MAKTKTRQKKRRGRRPPPTYAWTNFAPIFPDKQPAPVAAKVGPAPERTLDVIATDLFRVLEVLRNEDRRIIAFGSRIDCQYGEVARPHPKETVDRPMSVLSRLRSLIADTANVAASIRASMDQIETKI